MKTGKWLWLIILLLGYMISIASCTINQDSYSVTPTSLTTKPVTVQLATTKPRIETPGVTISSATPQPPATLTSMPPELTPTPTSELPSVLLLHSLQPEIGTLFLDQNGTILRKLDLRYMNIAQKGCFLYGLTSTDLKGSAVIVDRLNLSGKILERKTIPVQSNYFSMMTFGFTLSPDGNWIAYVEPGDDNEYDVRYSKKSNVRLLNLSQTDGIPKIVTERGRAPMGGAAWSPDSLSIAYSERDQNEITQIYLSNIKNGKKKQMTEFDQAYRNLTVYQIQYSPDGKYIGFIGENDKHNGFVGVIETDNHSLRWMQLPSKTYIPGQLQFFWNDTSDQILVNLNGSLNNGTNDQFITWFDVKTGEILKTFPKSGKKTYILSYIFPLSSDLNRVGFYGAEVKGEDNIGEYYVFDSISLSIKTIDLPSICCAPYEFIVLKEVKLSECE